MRSTRPSLATCTLIVLAACSSDNTAHEETPVETDDLAMRAGAPLFDGMGEHRDNERADTRLGTTVTSGLRFSMPMPFRHSRKQAC